jgi:hypothetical protein
MTCLSACLLAAVAVLAADGPGPAELVGHLGAAAHADREAAAQALRELGRDALPVLRRAREAKDAEIRMRAARLVDVIQRDWLTTPTPIPLEFDHGTVDCIVKAIDHRNGLRLVLLPPIGVPRPQRAITLRTKRPVTFWEAVEALCQASDLQTLPSNHFAGRPGEPTTYMMPRDRGPGASPYVTSGLFRIALESLELEGNARPGIPAGGDSRAELSARLLIEAEPRMFAVEDGLCGWAEAVDDRGQSLVPPGGAEARRSTPMGEMGFYATTELGTGQRFVLSARLLAPSQPGRTLKRLRGVLPVLLASREPEPLIVPLDAQPGVEIRDERIAITIGLPSFALARGIPGLAQVDLTIRALGPEPIRPRLLPFQIDVFDAEGIPFKLSACQVDLKPGEARAHLNLVSTTSGRNRPAKGELPEPPRASGPARLFFHHMFHSPAEVAFAFEDVPLP